MKPHHEHEYEAAPGLPEKLPAGECILWQGAPDPVSLGIHVFHLRALSMYFAAMLGLQALYLAGEPGGLVLRPLLIALVVACLALSLLGAVAWFAARGALYTITNRRVVMRIGIVLTITLNLPFKALSAAAVRTYKDGTGDIVVDLSGEDRMGWAHLWPHARPWALRRPQPSLRCLRDVQQVAKLLQSAWSAAHPELSALPSQAAALTPAAAPTAPARSPQRQHAVSA
ncbi:MAG: PH domain-containing protein [Rhodoferax sp.]|nr:PH domain-containing protein [Rhodoferax sp.]